MGCQASKRICNNLIVSNSVTFADGNLVINIPEGNYSHNCKYCIVVAQNLPDTATINAPVVVTIGTGTTTYPLVNCDCTNVLACSINRRTRYSTTVKTNVASGVFMLNGRIPCSRCANRAASLPIPTTPTA